jgi:sirohydrochlorin ferrochelatase
MQLPGRGDRGAGLTRNLLIVGHGSASVPGAGRFLAAQAERVAARGAFARVAFGFLAGAPSAAEALASLGDGPADVAPWFMEDGWFVRTTLPAALPRDPGLRFLAPVGTHPRVADAIAARCAGFRRVLLVGHGSARAPGRRWAAHAHADALRDRFDAVGVAFLEEPPDAATALAAMAGGRGARIPLDMAEGTGEIAVVGLFLNAGVHATLDLPRAVRASGARIRDLGPIGDDPALADIVHARASEGGTPCTPT